MQQTRIKNNVSPTKPTTIRSKLFDDLKNIKHCSYQGHECNQMSIENSNYCQRHIMDDKIAGYKQCSFIYNSNGKRCHLPGMKPDKKDNGYCAEHTLKMHVSKVRAGPRHQPPQTPELLLSSLSHYVKPSRKRNLSSSTQYSDEGHSSTEDQSLSKVTKCLDPFVDVDAFTVNAAASDILEYASDSESDVEAATYSTVWHDAQVESSDNESIDSEQEDPLKHASVYTAEEVTLVTKDKLKRLQSLYIEQFRYLQYVLKERRRKYVHSLRRERDTFCSIYNQTKESPKDLQLYNKLKALNQYQKKLGVDAIMQKKRNDLRAKITEGLTAKPPSITKCAFAEGGVKCGERSLPVARHCRKHILEDPNQILFRACGRQKSDMQCPTPVETIFPDATCRLHLDIPVIRNYAQTRKDSESDFDESLGGDMHHHHHHVDSALSNATIVRQAYHEGYFAAQSPECSDWSNFQAEQFSADENTMDTDFKMMNPDSIQSYVDDIKTEQFHDAVDNAAAADVHDTKSFDELSLNISDSNAAAAADGNMEMLTEQSCRDAQIKVEQTDADVATPNVQEVVDILKEITQDSVPVAQQDAIGCNFGFIDSMQAADSAYVVAPSAAEQDSAVAAPTVKSEDEVPCEQQPIEQTLTDVAQGTEAVQQQSSENIEGLLADCSHLISDVEIASQAVAATGDAQVSEELK